MLAFNLLLLCAAVLALLLLYRSSPTRERLRRCIAIDTRSLAVFRVLVGLLVVADVLSRARNFHYFYTDAGVVPRELAIALLSDHAGSVFLLSSSELVTAGLLAAHVVVALGLVVGYRTRLATLVTFLLVASLDYRNPLVLSYADTLFVLLLFWAVFLPLGERWSADALRAEDEPRRTVADLASFLVLLQVVAMYFVNATQKAESELWRSGEAMVFVMGLDDITFLLGDLLRAAPDLLQFGGLAWYLLVWFSPLLLVLTGRSRATYASLLVLANLLLALTVRIGAFPYVSIAGLSLFYGPTAWRDGAAIRERISGAAPAVWTVPAVRPALGRAGERLEARLPVLPEPDLVRSPTVRDGVSILVVTLLLVAGTSMAVENLQAAGIVHEDHDFVLEELVDPANELLRTEQPSWTIFAPEPRSVDYYYVFPAETSTGELRDVYNERPLSYDRPQRALNRQYPTYRHRFYMNAVRRSALRGGYAGTHRHLAEYYCENWADPDGSRIRFLNMYAVRETVTRSTIDDPAGRERDVILLYRHSCVDGAPPRPIRPP